MSAVVDIFTSVFNALDFKNLILLSLLMDSEYSAAAASRWISGYRLSAMAINGLMPFSTRLPARADD
jgi:hypothetical protein